jgi:hypothetical protein
MEDEIGDGATTEDELEGGTTADEPRLEEELGAGTPIVDELGIGAADELGIGPVEELGAWTAKELGAGAVEELGTGEATDELEAARLLELGDGQERTRIVLVDVVDVVATLVVG